MDLIKNGQMVYIGDSKEKKDNTAICPYCGREVHFSRENAVNPKAVTSCEHFTSIFTEARNDSELTYEQYARFREV